MVEFGQIFQDKQRRKSIWCQTAAVLTSAREQPKSLCPSSIRRALAPQNTNSCSYSCHLVQILAPQNTIPVPAAVTQFRYLTKTPWISQIPDPFLLANHCLALTGQSSTGSFGIFRIFGLGFQPSTPMGVPKSQGGSRGGAQAAQTSPNTELPLLLLLWGAQTPFPTPQTPFPTPPMELWMCPVGKGREVPNSSVTQHFPLCPGPRCSFTKHRNLSRINKP